MKPIDEKRLERTKDFILSFQRAEGKSPTFRQIMKECGHSSLSRVAFDVEVLKERGHFANDSDCPICVPDNLRAGKTKSALIVGECACGEPICAIENVKGAVALPVEIFGEGEHFILQAKGNSMTGSGIYDKDLMVVSACKSAPVGKVVIALIGDEATAKILAKDEGGLYLKPSNDATENGERVYKDIRPSVPWEIVGVVEKVIHTV